MDHAADQLENQVDALLAGVVEPGGPGAAVAILRDGAFIHRKAYGLANVEWNIPLTPDSVFRICSLTKQFTAVAIMMLAERGQLSIDARLETYLTDWPARGRSTTLRSLLNHTSGVWKHDGELGDRTKRANPSVAEVIATIFARPFEFETGERYSYNNSGYLLLGAVIAAVSRQSYEAFLGDNIFKPLGMDHTGILRHEAITPKRAFGYLKGRRGLYNARLDAMNWSHSAGALGSTLDDLAKWDGALRDHLLIGPETLELMLEPTPLNGGESFPYGFGWGLTDYAGRRVFHHTGGISGFGCHMLHMRDEDLTTIVLSNLYTFPFDRITRGLLRVALGLPPVQAPLKTPKAGWLDVFAGRYDSDDGAPFVISESNPDLVALDETRLCDRADPEVEYRFSELSDGGFRRLDYCSPLWPTSTFRRAS